MTPVVRSAATHSVTSESKRRKNEPGRREAAVNLPKRYCDAFLEESDEDKAPDQTDWTTTDQRYEGHQWGQLNCQGGGQTGVEAR